MTYYDSALTFGRRDGGQYYLKIIAVFNVLRYVPLSSA